MLYTYFSDSASHKLAHGIPKYGAPGPVSDATLELSDFSLVLLVFMLVFLSNIAQNERSVSIFVVDEESQAGRYT